jgi:hypothetical protein
MPEDMATYWHNEFIKADEKWKQLQKQLDNHPETMHRAALAMTNSRQCKYCKHCLQLWANGFYCSRIPGFPSSIESLDFGCNRFVQRVKEDDLDSS